MSDMTAISVRLYAKQRAQLETIAHFEHRSLNAEIVSRLDDSLDGFGIAEFLGPMELPRVIRMRSSNTSTDRSRIVRMLKRFAPQRVLLAARRDPYNNAVLVFVAYFDFATVILDGSGLSMARTPREHEIQDIFRALEFLGYLSTTLCAHNYAPETRELPPDEALAAIESSDVRPLTDIRHFLDLLSVHKIYDLEEFRTK